VSIAELGKFSLLAQLDDAERGAVVDELESFELAAGIPLFREGEPADGALFVAEGRVRVHSPRAGLDAEFGVGEALGTLSLVVDGPREATAETASHARIWRLSRGRLSPPRRSGASCRVSAARGHSARVRGHRARGDPPGIRAVRGRRWLTR
jgi:hypothetical protein